MSNQSANIPEMMKILDQRIAQVEERFSEMGYSVKRLVTTEIKSGWKIPAQQETIYGMHTAICVETIDPWKQGRVRFFSPLEHIKNPTIKSLPWAYPISNQGGFDDCGSTWVPPAGSKLCLIFESGNRQWPYYLGTTWDRDRSKGWGIPMPEYEKIHQGHRGGYMVGDDETQVFPPWNTENYNGFDIDSIYDFTLDTQAQNDITYPNIYGWKTPQKHMIKMVDGNYKCNFRWQRLEIKSSQGNHLIFKDDRLHPAAQWANPDCGCGGSGGSSKCNEGDEPIEQADQCPQRGSEGSSGDNRFSAPDVLMIGSGKPNQTASKDGGGSEGQCLNPYFKHKSECRPYSGPGNPQNNKVDKTTLPQSGIQLTSLSGHTFWMDDAVSDPRGKNNWEKGIEKFDYGCDDVFKGKTVWKSAHGHQIMMSDVEPDNDPYGRSSENFIRIMSATGNRIELNDETSSKTCTAGARRGIELQSTSNHLIQMIDENNDQCNNKRREGGGPVNKATNAFVRIRTGYGLEVMMADDNHQEDTQSQYIQIMAPQKDACAGPHMIRMQESDYCGYIFVRAGGDYMCMSEGDHVTVVGVGKTTPEDDFCKGGCLGPRNWFTAVSQHSVHWSCKFYFNKAETHAFLADKMILLLAGKDCPPPPDDSPLSGEDAARIRNAIQQAGGDVSAAAGNLGLSISELQGQLDSLNGGKCGPCLGPVAVLLNGKLVASDRIYASASLESQVLSITQLQPFAKNNEPGSNCKE